MRKLMILSILIFAFILTGCEADDLKSENIHLTSRLNEVNLQIAELTEKLTTHHENFKALNTEFSNVNQQLEAASHATEQAQQQLKWHISMLTDITNIEDFHYEIISQAIERAPHDKVVYIKDVPGIHQKQLVYLLKAALVFSDDDAHIVTFWRDRNRAILYRDGKYDAEEGPLGWSGFDYRFGAIINDGKHSMLRQYNSRDDSQFLDFGKYSSRE